MPGAIGLFAGLSLNTYLLANLCADRATIENLVRSYQFGEFQTVLGNDKDFLTTRVAYKLNLRGPGHDGADGLLDLARRHRPGLPEPAEFPVRHGHGRRGFDHFPAGARAINTRRGRWAPRMGIAGRSTPPRRARSLAMAAASWC